MAVRFFTVVILGVLYLYPAYGQVEDFNSLTLKVFSNISLYRTEFTSDNPVTRTTFTNEILYEPSGNANFVWGLQLSYKKLFSLSYSWDVIQDDDINERRSYRFSTALGRYFVQAKYENLRSMVVINSHEIDPTEFANENIADIREDIKSTTMGLNIIGVLNPDKFSIAALIDQTQRQTRSGYSLIGAISISHDTIQGDEPIFSFQGDTNPDATGGDLFTKSEFVSATVSAGIGATTASNNGWFLGGYALYGIGLQSYDYTAFASSDKGTQSTTKIDVMISFGYHGKQGFGGFQYIIDRLDLKVDQLEGQSNTDKYSLYLGLHF